MPKRRRKNAYDDEEVEVFSFIDIPTDSASIKPTTVSDTRVINVVEWNIDGNRVSTSNTLTTSTIEKTSAVTSDGCSEPHWHADYDQLEYEFPNAVSDISSTNAHADPLQSASKQSARTLIMLVVILVLILSPIGLPYAFLAQRNRHLPFRTHPT